LDPWIHLQIPGQAVGQVHQVDLQVVGQAAGMGRLCHQLGDSRTEDRLADNHPVEDNLVEGNPVEDTLAEDNLAEDIPVADLEFQAGSPKAEGPRAVLPSLGEPWGESQWVGGRVPEVPGPEVPCLEVPCLEDPSPAIPWAGRSV